MCTFNKIFMLLSYFILCLKGELDYEISVPEFICDKTHGISTSTTTIGLTGEGKFRFKLNFEKITDPCKNIQRCNLFVWKIIREFENFLNSYSYAQTNSIKFNNSMLIPGLKYILDVSISQGKIKEKKQYSIDFFDNSLANSTPKPMASISVIGPTSIEAHTPYILNAKINSCSNISNYYIEWKLLNNTKHILETFSERGLELTIPAFTLHSGTQYYINCSLIKMDDSEIITSNLKSVKVNKNSDSLIVKLPTIYTTMNIQHSVRIKPYIMDLSNTNGEMKIRWSCLYDNKNICNNKTADTLNIEKGFLNQGEYNITIEVSKNSIVTKGFSLIRILRNVPSIEIDTIQTPLSPSSGVVIKGNIDNLRTFCTLQWKSEEGPYFLDLNNLPGKVNELHKVVVKQDQFLEELEEYSNDASSKQYHLLIPPPTGAWQGLPNKDYNYKLRFLLEAKCPTIQLQDDNVEVEYSEDIFNNTTTVSALVEIEVVVAPKPQPLKVEPATGLALEVMFTFQTSAANETGTKPPFLYKFGYILEDREYTFCNMLEYRKCETVLPYIDDGIQTFLEVCDSFNSCRKVFGPRINTTLPAEINKNDVLQKFAEKINSEDFYKAFGYALTVLYTAKLLNEEEVYRQYFSEGVYSKIQYLLKSYGDDVFWTERTNKLINCISDYNKELTFSDTVLNGLVDLRMKLVREKEDHFLAPQRRLLSENIWFPDFDNVKSYLEVSDLIIANSKNETIVEFEKEYLPEKLKLFLGSFCSEIYKGQDKISLGFKSLIIVVEQFEKKSYHSFHIIPYNGNPWNSTAHIKFNIQDMINLKPEKLCIAKFLYKDFFNKSGLVYEAVVSNANDGKILRNIRSTVLLPYDKKGSAEQIPRCVVYNGQWHDGCRFIKIISNFVQCSCSVMGGYYLEYEDGPVLEMNIQVMDDDNNKLATTTLSTVQVDDTDKDHTNHTKYNDAVGEDSATVSTAKNPIDISNKDTEKTLFSYEDNADMESGFLTRIFTLNSSSITTYNYQGTSAEVPSTLTSSSSANSTFIHTIMENTVTNHTSMDNSTQYPLSQE